MQSRASYLNMTRAILCIWTLVIQQIYTIHILWPNSRHSLRILRHPVSNEGPRGGAVYWGTALRAGSSRVRLLMVSLEFFIDYGAGVDSAFNRNEYQKYSAFGKSLCT